MKENSLGRVCWALVCVYCLSGCGEVLGIESLREDPALDDSTSETADSKRDDAITMTFADTEGSHSDQAASPKNDADGEDADGEDAADEEGASAADHAMMDGEMPGAGTMAIADNDGEMGEEEPPAEEADQDLALSPISGRIVDPWGLPVTDALVQVGDASMTTGADGRFEFDAVPPTYDVDFTYSAGRRGSFLKQVYGWVYEGLTRRDPTLQALHSSMENGQSLVTNVSSVPESIPDEQHLEVAFGCPSGAFSFDMSSPKVEYLSGVYYGPERVAGTTHALYWEQQEGLPTGYLGHDAVPTALIYGEDAAVSLDVSKEKPESGSIAGRISALSGSQPEINVYVRFDDNALVNVVSKWVDEGESFSYMVPKLANASIVVHARSVANDTSVVVEQVAVGSGELALELPKPPTLTAPTMGFVGASDEVEFAWKGQKPVSVLSVGPSAYYERLYVVTAATSFKLRGVAEGAFALRLQETLDWTVSHHGNFESVDAATGEGGFVSPAWSTRTLSARRGDGEFAPAAYRELTLEN